MHQVLSNKRTIFLLVVPGFLFFLFMVCIPIAMSVYYGMTDWRGIGAYQMVGFDNFINILTHDKVFWRSLWNAVLLVIATVALQHPIAILFAILLTHMGKWEKLFRVLFFIPAVISIVVTSKLWSAIYHPNFGLLNKVLESIGLASWKQEWLGNPDIAIWSLIITIMWQGFGYALLLYYAGLQGIPEDLYEAAKLDGANHVQLYMKIIIPLLAPMMRVAIILAVITCLKQMETVFLMTNGGPGESTQFLGNYVYKAAFSSSLYGYGNAISVLFVIFCLILTVIMNKFLKKDVGEF
ncbi:carbohydrate ABC transporter permease [Paenibacillus endoradicis]|uniref:carbohydrate ABC transporter permease n=1 Tax=Paenibacillus endoradicis TaxID=2972487 RepID=UPI00215997BE|nr:sugar ABC transporter permease [Paenibacillus endoradicis]MCR8657206.1 sugar ABC transporter permease [Paenibacillus endoradicis]